MPVPYPTPSKKPVNLTVREDLLIEAKSYGFNLSATFEKALEEQLREERKRRWLEENREAIAHHKERIRREGMWHKGLTPWYGAEAE